MLGDSGRHYAYHEKWTGSGLGLPKNWHFRGLFPPGTRILGHFPHKHKPVIPSSEGGVQWRRPFAAFNCLITATACSQLTQWEHAAQFFVASFGFQECLANPGTECQSSKTRSSPRTVLTVTVSIQPSSINSLVVVLYLKLPLLNKKSSQKWLEIF